MARNRITPVILTGQFTFVSNSAEEQYFYFPDPVLNGRDAQPLTPPVSSGSVLPSKGYVRSVLARVNTGGALTLSNLQVGIYRDLRSWPDGTDGFTLTAIPDERKVYVSNVVASPTPSAVTADIDDRLSSPEPYERGIWIAATTSGSTGTPGSTTVAYRIWLDAIVD